MRLVVELVVGQARGTAIVRKRDVGIPAFAQRAVLEAAAILLAVVVVRIGGGCVAKAYVDGGLRW